jgi:hypothetical protein
MNLDVNASVAFDNWLESIDRMDSLAEEDILPERDCSLSGEAAFCDGFARQSLRESIAYNAPNRVPLYETIGEAQEEDDSWMDSPPCMRQ